jgi:hypothetical protein
MKPRKITACITPGFHSRADHPRLEKAVYEHGTDARER